ncbi:MAG: S1 RNA-binding domain-containing protein [Planctomycetota bacterium]|nr:S1 RNA-binding domain-containing protein [Planctomycetota bacterium]
MTNDLSSPIPEDSPTTPESAVEIQTAVDPVVGEGTETTDTPCLEVEAANQSASAQELTQKEDVVVDSATDGDDDSSEPVKPVDDAVKPASRKIQIGSRRTMEKKESPTGSKPHLANQQPPALPPTPVRTGPVPIPSVRDTLSEELEAEITAALGDQTASEELLDASVSSAAGTVLESDSRHRATVIRVDEAHVFVSLGGANEGVVQQVQLNTQFEVGMELDVVVTGYNQEHQIYDVRIPGASVNVADWADLQEGVVTEVSVTGHNVGGLECQVNSIRGFIPASQVALYRVENLEEYVGRKLSCVVTEADAQRRNLVLSHRSVLEREAAVEREKKMASLEVGTIQEGIVRNIRDFGVFVDLGGVDGLVHVSQMSWDRVSDPNELVSVGDTVRVRIEKIHPQTGKIGLSLRALQPHPWEGVAERFRVAEIVSGTVTRIADFGAFVKIGPGIEGLVHISEMAHQRVSSVGSVVSEGQEIKVKILSVDAENQRIGLSIKQTMEAPAKASEGEAEELPLSETVVKKANAPLKGGTDRSAGGEQFGLKW